MRRSSLMLLLALPVLGCGGRSFSQTEVDRARQALETSLTSWKKGEPAAGLKKLPEPILFAEEWPERGLRLLAYEITDSKHTDAETIRFSVKLTVQDRRGRKEERRVTYAVALKSPIAVGRDPYF
jgi:hypothetical protein